MKLLVLRFQLARWCQFQLLIIGQRSWVLVDAVVLRSSPPHPTDIACGSR